MESLLGQPNKDGVGEDIDRLGAELADHFDALVGEVERIVEHFLSVGVSEADIERLQRVKIIAERGATIVRTKLKD